MYRLSEFFDPILMESSVDTGLEVRTLVRIFRNRGVRSVLDIACGTGRHAISLVEKGYEVTGIDYSPSQIKVAREKNKGHEKQT